MSLLPDCPQALPEPLEMDACRLDSLRLQGSDSVRMKCRHVDAEALATELAAPRDQRLTPKMFIHQIMQRCLQSPLENSWVVLTYELLEQLS